MSYYQMFSMAEDFASYVPCDKRPAVHAENALYVPYAHGLRLSTDSNDSLQKNTEGLYVEGFFMPLSNNSIFEGKVQSFEDAEQLNPSFGQQGPLNEQCFSELIKSSLKLPPITGRQPSLYPMNSINALEFSNFENNNGAGMYADPGECVSRKDGSIENSNLLVTVGEDFKDGDYTLNALKGAARSYEDFKSKDFCTKIERNFSSPILPSQSPVTDCGRLSAGSNPNVSKTNHPILDCASCQPDAEDLEVAMINESFEEQQKQSQIYENTAMKSLYFPPTNKSLDSSGLCSSIDSSLTRVTSEDKGSHERMPYTASINNNKKHMVYKDESLLQNKTSLNAAITVGEDTLSIQQSALSDVPAPELTSMRASQAYEPTYQRISLDNIDRSRKIFEEEDEQKLSDFDVEEMILDDAALRRAAQTLSCRRFMNAEPLSEPILTESRRDFVKTKKERSASDAIPIFVREQVQFPLGSAEEKLDATAAIALNMVESLFVGGNSLDHSSPLFYSAIKEETSMKDGEGGLGYKDCLVDEELLAPAVKNVFDAYRSSLKQTEPVYQKTGCMSPGVEPEIRKGISEEVTREKVSPVKELCFVATYTTCDSAVDSWEDLDSDDSKLDEIQSAIGKMKVRKPKIDYFTPPETTETDWSEKELPNVLEAYGLPSRITYDDIKYELAKFDCADVTFQRVDESHCLIAFSSANAALKALLAARQRSGCPWLRLRSMCDASKAAQEKARTCLMCLKPYKPRPQTTMVVARRLVENALGKRSNVSMEQRRAEQKQLSDARVQKEAKAALWEDIS